MDSFLRNRSALLHASRLSILLGMGLLNVALLLPTARAQANAKADDACVAGSMTNLISRRVNSVNVSRVAEAAQQAEGVRGCPGSREYADAARSTTLV
jgi:hypothetical protein